MVERLRFIEKEVVEGCICKEATEGDILRSDRAIKEMIDLCLNNYGAGLAAPQVGIMKRFFVIKLDGSFIACFNPKILFSSPQKSAMRECCLTYGWNLNPRLRPSVNIMRAKTVEVEFTNTDKEQVKMKLRGFDAKCFQHELDHLNGKTIFYTRSLTNNSSKGRGVEDG